MNAKSIGYWTATGILAFAFLSGGMAYLAHIEATVAGVVLLGYPPYFVTILGFWKLLGGIVLVVPGLPRVKEWAYAGMFFDVTSAAVSHVTMADYGAFAFHVVVNVFFAVLVVVSWALRPPNRALGVLPPAKLASGA